MSEPKFTPGPWKWERDEDGLCDLLDKNGNRIIRIDWHNQIIWAEPADADLIERACEIPDLTRQRDNLRYALVAAEGRLLSSHVQDNPLHLGILGAGEIKWALDVIQMALLPYRSEAFKEAPVEAEEGV